MAKPSKRIPTDGGAPLTHNPFGALSAAGLPAGPEAAPAAATPAPPKQRGRVEIRRQTAHRGGKTVTVVSGFVGIALAEKEELARRLQKSCGVGGTVKDGQIELHGDQREAVVRMLTEAGFRPVLAGG
ncbi:MAG: translation initiation factor [Verrucomicrobia bacterium]|nr:translation initiation factor [Verrucomicrobiota bacterium]